MLAFAVLLCLTANVAFSQAVTGTLLGTVTDATGAVVPNAKVTATEQNTGVSRTSETTQAGYYAFPNLPPGVYTVTMEVTGFKKGLRQNVEVLVNSTMRVDMTLQPGNVTESVDVTAEAPLLQTDRSDTGRKIETKQIVDLPLGFNRNFQGLLNLTPGATRGFRPHSEFFNSQDSLSTQVNGQGRLSNNVQLEGIDNNHRTGLLTALIPPSEALQTVDITTSNYEASLGRAGGAVTNVLMKSGTNQYHGSLYEYNRVSALGARNFFAATKPVQTYNYFGGTFGGPIIKNKLFFFGDYLRVMDRRGQTDRWTLPTAAAKNGNLSAAPSVIYDPGTGNPDGTGRTPFAGNVIPPGRISPIARTLLGFVSDPNLPGINNNFVQNLTLQKDTDNFDIKGDYNISANDLLTARYSFQRPKVTDPCTFGINGGPHGGGFCATGINKVQNGAIGYTHIFSPTLLTDLRVGVNRFRNDAQQLDYGSKASDAVGIKGVNLDNWTSGLTQIDISNFANPLVGYSASLPWIRAETNYNLVNTWTKTFGSHTVKWGGDIRWLRDNLLQTQTFNPRGVFRYREGNTSIPGAPVSWGNSFAAFLLDQPQQAGRDLAQFFPTWNQWFYFLYVQDKWQITPKLTLDYGLRWEFYKPPTPLQPGGFSNYDWQTNRLVLAGIGGNPSDMGLQKNYKNFAPRIGLAYRLNDKNVIRAGYGWSYLPYPDNTYAWDNFPVKQNNAFNQLNSFTPSVDANGRVVNMASGFPAPVPVSIPSNGIISPAPISQNYNVIPQNFREGYVQSWNFAYQRSLPWNLVFESAYVGNKGTRMPVLYNLNAGVVAGAGANGQPLFATFRRTADTNLRYVPTANNYNSLQAKLDKRFSNGFLMTTAYTYGKGIGVGTGDQQTGGLFNYIDRTKNRARNDYDRTHMFNQSYLYQLPFGKGKRYLNGGGISDWVLGGWQVNGVLSIMSGTPYELRAPGNVLNAPGNTNTLNQIGPVRTTGIINDAPWIDITSFAVPAQNSIGSLGRNSLVGPGFFNLDASLFKNFKMTERFNLEFRAEGYSITNTPQFANPGNTFGAANYGRITGTLGTGNAGTQGGARAIQFGLRLNF